MWSETNEITCQVKFTVHTVNILRNMYPTAGRKVDVRSDFRVETFIITC